MSNIILFDTEARSHLQPLTATRPMGEMRIGTLTLREKWERRMRASVSYITQEYLQHKYPIIVEDDNLIVSAGALPTEALCERLGRLERYEALLHDGKLLAARLPESLIELLIEDEPVRELQGTDIGDVPVIEIERPWQMTRLNGVALRDDFSLLTRERQSAPLSETNRLIGPLENLFIEAGASIEGCILNVTTGPIYIGKDAIVMEGCLLRGPISIGEEAVLKMGAKIYGPTTIGPGCRVGGEIKASILMANSNKGHEGYLGDSVIGEWCNLGADTNTSNLKNNYGEIKLWDYETERFAPTGEQFCGLMMGDHAKSSINTMFNSGTVVGVSANVFGAGFPRNFVPDFSWGGGDAGYRTYRFEDACATAVRVMERRNIPFTDIDKGILYHIYDRTARFRSWEKMV